MPTWTVIVERKGGTIERRFTDADALARYLVTIAGETYRVERGVER